MNRCLRTILVAVPLLLTAVHAGEVFQFHAAIEVRSNKTVTGSLWVPTQADRIRGVCVGSMRPAATDSNVRQVCAELKLANTVAPLDEQLPVILAELGRGSGYPEAGVVPWLPWGHSAGTVDASYIMARNNARCFGAIIFQGGLCWPPELGRDYFRSVPIARMVPEPTSICDIAGIDGRVGQDNMSLPEIQIRK